MRLGVAITLACAASLRAAESAALRPSPRLKTADLARLRGGPVRRASLPRAPAIRPGLVCCGGGACLSVSQSSAVRLLARDSRALQLKRSCLWFSGCVSGTRLSLKPLIYHQENNQICPRGPHLPPTPGRRLPHTPGRRLLPLCRPPFSPAFPSPGLFLSLHYHHSFLSFFTHFPPPRPCHPSSSSSHRPRLFSPFI